MTYPPLSLETCKALAAAGFPQVAPDHGGAVVYEMTVGRVMSIQYNSSVGSRAIPLEAHHIACPNSCDLLAALQTEYIKTRTDEPAYNSMKLRIWEDAKFYAYAVHDGPNTDPTRDPYDVSNQYWITDGTGDTPAEALAALWLQLRGQVGE